MNYALFAFLKSIKLFFIKGGKMTIKKFVLTATAVATVFAFTVPVSFAACSTGAACPIDSLQKVNPNTTTCTKCKSTMDACKCKKKGFFNFLKRNKCNPCETGAAAPCDPCKVKKDDCGCKKDPCAKPKCDKCSTGVGSSCLNQRTHSNMQVYAYPGAIYSPANVAVTGELNNNSSITDQTIAEIPVVPGVRLSDDCITGAAAPIIDQALLPPKEDCCPGANVQSPNSMQAIYKEMEPVKTDCGCTTGAASNVSGNNYPDVPNRYWASGDINRLTDQCVVVGYPDDFFKPNKFVTRAEMAAMVVKGFNLESTAMTSEGNFSDVPYSHWAHDFINKGVSADMLAGHSSNKFLPNNHITRAEALTIMSKGLKCPMDDCKANEILNQYRDGNQVPNWARECVAKAIDVGALKDSKTSDLIRPNENATRAEIASMLQNTRIAGGYDKNAPEMTAIGPTQPTFIEKETPVCIPTLQLTMKDQVNAKNANVGEQFAAETIHEITVNGVTYPAGSRVNGKITEVIRPSKCNPGAIKLSFTEIVGCDGCKQILPKQVLTAKVEKCKDVNPIVRLVQMPFTFVGSTLGLAGRTVGGAAIGLSNAVEGLFDQAGTGTGEILSGQFKAGGRSYIDGIKTTLKAPVDIVRTAAVGTAGLFNNTVDEIAYVVDGAGNRITRVNPKDKMTIAFGNDK